MAFCAVSGSRRLRSATILAAAATCGLLLGCRAEDVVAIADSVVAGAPPNGGTAGTAGTAGTSPGGSFGEGGSQAASCGDSVLNQGESDVDCGGPCPACAIDAACTSSDDCASGSCADSKCATTLSVYYTTSSRIASALSVRPSFEIHNDGPSVVPLSELEIRYFFTNEGSGTPVAQCPILPSDCDVLQLSFGVVDPPRPLADSYLSVGFNTSAPSLAAGSISKRYEVGFRNSGIGPLQQTNDYSYDSSFDQAAPSQKTCLYRNGKLIWGLEPPP